ncbi:MAG: J domain-containing protein [Tannerella sp.]|jgi:hypothetical protein|nr:J domain-containing protein [Tannerella sp.]
MSAGLPQLMDKGALKEEYFLLKKRYAKLLTNRDFLLGKGKSELEALYHTKIGGKQLELIELRYEVEKLKKMIGLAVNRFKKRKQIDWDEIEAKADAMIDEEDGEYERKVYVNQLDTSSNDSALSEREAELRKLYRQLAKILHPDVNRNLSEKQKNLWAAVQSAYNEGDLETLRTLAAMVNEIDYSIDNKSFPEIELQIKLLKISIKKLTAEVRRIRTAFPFNFEKKLKDKKWVKMQNDRVEMLIRVQFRLKEQYEARLELLNCIF